MLSSLFEGVDTVQYSHESAIANYFKSKSMTLEQSMITIAKAPKADLIKMAIESGVYNDLVYYISHYNINNFKPSIGGEIISSLGKNGRRLDQEIDQFLNENHLLEQENHLETMPSSPNVWYYERTPHQERANVGHDYIWARY